MSLSSIGFGAQPTTAWEDMQAWRSKRQDSRTVYSLANSAARNALTTAATNQLNGLVNLAADAAATRLGINLHGSRSGKPSSAKTPTPAAGAPSTAFTHIDQVLAKLDGNGFTPPAKSGAGTNFDLAKLDQIATGVKPRVAARPNGKFDLNSYLANLDVVAATTPVTTPAVDVTA